MIQSFDIANVRPSKNGLRPLYEESLEFLQLIDSIRNKGFIGCLSGFEKVDPETGQSYIEVLDGSHRLEAARRNGIKQIQIDLQKNLAEPERLEAQIMMNIHKIETKAIEYTKALQRLMNYNPTMTVAALAKKLARSEAWINERLGLLKIKNVKIQELVNDGVINISNAYALSKLPEEEQDQWIAEAQTMPPNEFAPKTKARLREINEARRKGQKETPKEFVPAQYFRKSSEIMTEISTLKQTKLILQESGVNDPMQAFVLGLKWVLHIDPLSVKEQKKDYDDRQAQKKAELEQRKQEREKKKQEQAISNEVTLTAAVA